MLIVLASLIGLASILTTWVNRQMFDNESWKTASADLIEDQQVRDAVSVFLVNELYANVDVAAELETRLPDNLDTLAAPLAAALRQSATTTIGRLLDAPRVQQLWVDANAAAQEKLVNVLENTTGDGISTGEGVVTVDLSELVTELGTELGLPDAALARIPPDAGVITVMRSDQLAAAQAGVRAVRILSAALLVLVLAMYGLAIYLARGARRQTIRNIGFAFVLVGLVVLVVRQVAGDVAIDALTAPPGENAGTQAWLIGTRDPGADRLGRGALRRHRGRRRHPRRTDEGGRRRPRQDRAGAQWAAGHRLGERRRCLRAADPLGRDSRLAHLVGHPAAGRADRDRRRRAPPPDATGVPVQLCARGRFPRPATGSCRNRRLSAPADPSPLWALGEFLDPCPQPSPSLWTAQGQVAAGFVPSGR